MALNQLSILGFRGFKNLCTIQFAVPKEGNPGSGLTVLTGANNSGKSSILECLRARSGHAPPSFSVGVRNAAVEAVNITYTFNGVKEEIQSVQKGSSETIKSGTISPEQIFCLPSRRAFPTYFGKSVYDRSTQINSAPLPAQRTPTLDAFAYRLFKIFATQADKDKFDEILTEVLGYKAEWAIDLSEQGSYFLKFFNSGSSHSSDGMGEGIVSIFSIIDALYDSSPGDIIVIDEPELSLHPSLQRRLSQVFRRFSSDRQIIISTHSPYFVDIASLANGCQIIRATSNDEGSICHQLSQNSIDAISTLANGNLYNPHIFGLDSRELFFQDDGIILTEGQEDVLLFPKIASDIEERIPGNFFGWGVGGAGNIKYLCTILNDLGFERVATILDGDKIKEAEKLSAEFPQFFFINIPADDIRTKSARKATDETLGILDRNLTTKPEYIEPMRGILRAVGEYISK